MYILAAFCSIFAVPFLLLNVWLWVSWPIIMLIVTLVGLVLSTISLCFSTKMQTYVYDYVCPEDNQDELKDKLSNLFENLGEKDDEDKTPEETD